MDSHGCEMGKFCNNAVGEGGMHIHLYAKNGVVCQQPESLQPQPDVWLNLDKLGKNEPMIFRCFFDVISMFFSLFFDVISMFFRCFGAKNRFYIDFTSILH